MAVGLAFSALSMATSLIGNSMEHKEVVDETRHYTPDPMAFRNAGLFNNSVDLGETRVDVQRTEENASKTALEKLSNIYGAAASMGGAASGIVDSKTSIDANGLTNQENRQDRKVERMHQRDLRKAGRQ